MSVTTPSFHGFSQKTVGGKNANANGNGNGRIHHLRRQAQSRKPWSAKRDGKQAPGAINPTQMKEGTEVTSSNRRSLKTEEIARTRNGRQRPSGPFYEGQ